VLAGQSTQLWLAAPGRDEKKLTSVSLAVTGLEPGKPYVLALASEATGGGALEPLQGFMTNPAGAAVVKAIVPIRQLVRGEDRSPRRHLVIAPGPRSIMGLRSKCRLSEATLRSRASSATFLGGTGARFFAPKPLAIVRSGHVASFWLNAISRVSAATASVILK